MPTSVIEHIRRVVGDGVGLRDGELLGRYVDRRDEAALAALVNRHGPMVWGVCRRHLSHHDAEDAFQATFIVLVRKAASIAQREAVGNWLYGVAHQTALQAQRSAARRRAREVQVTKMPDAEAPQERWADLQPLLDEELSRLPDHYRTVIVLSDLEGRTRKEVAAQLGCPEGTVASRLVRARSMLAKRLTRRGVALSGGALAVVLSQSTGSACVPAAVVSSTIEAARLCAAGQAAIPVKVAALAEGVLKAMLLNKLKPALAVLVVVAMVGLIGYGMARGQQKGDAVQKPASEPKAQKDAVVKEKAEKEDATAWGKVVDGLQAGLLAEAATGRVGEKLTFTVKLRNVGKAEVSVTYMLSSITPSITTDSGERVKVYMPPPYAGFSPPITRTIQPGETITLHNPKVAVEPEDQAKLLGVIPYGTSTICVAPGKYKIAFDRMIQSHPKLSTGTVEFEVKPASVTAWGKEFSGLQAGLGFRPGEQRAYRQGETVKVVLRVRNVGKESVDFKHIWAFFVENPPKITDADGKVVQLPKYKTREQGSHMLRSSNVAPGKEVELYEWTFDLQANGENSSRSFIHGTGKHSLQCERIVGPTWLNPVHPNPALDKLATGKLELEVTSDRPMPANEFPVGWGGGGGTDYELSVDRTVKHGGKASGSIKSIVIEPTWYGAFTQAFKADDFRGKRLRMTAYVRSKNVENAAGLCMRIESIDGNGNYILSSDLMNRPIKGTNDWKQCEVVLDVPKEGSAAISFGAMLAGKGQVWVDDFKFEIVDNSVKTTGRIREPVKSKYAFSKGLPKEPKNLDFEE